MRKRERMIPTGDGVREVRRPGVDAVVYLTGPTTAMGYSGKRTKRDFYYSFAGTERRDRFVAEYLYRMAIRQAEKRERREAIRAFRAGFKVGDVLVYEWGYEQTNPEFFQVVEVMPSGRSVRIREIAQEGIKGTEGFMTESRRPLPGRYVGEPVLKRVRPSCSQYNPEGVISMPYGIARKMTSDRATASWYG